MVPRSLFAGLVDDAALFPPGNAPMVEALADHAVVRSSPRADLVGPFLCPASRIDELVTTLPSDESIDLALVFDVTGDGAHQALRVATPDPRIRLVAVEASHARLGDDAEAVGRNLDRHSAATGFLEVPRTGFESGLDLVAASGWHAAKYRTGGLKPDAFPTEGELAAFLLAVAGRRLPFKLTAGLHHAVRTTAGDGLEQHGVLNILTATRVAANGGSLQAVAVVLAQRDPGPLVELVQGWDDSTCGDVRAAFRSFGCCGVADPLDELSALGLLEDHP